MNRDALRLVAAHEPRHFAIARMLFQEYAAQLGIDLSFQDFATELTSLPAMYGPPSGILYLVMNGSSAVGCGGVRGLSGGACEMKRLYIRPEVRGSGWGRRVAKRLIQRARSMGYERMRLDTLDDMLPALTLYRSLGFREIDAYYLNPLSNSVYLELLLPEPRIAADGLDPGP